MTDIKLTQFSSGAGCGCKISSSVLAGLLDSLKINAFNDLIIGNESKDDAAVYNMGKGIALISTTDFFTPIVDDAYDYGRISAANAISDVYAMGGKPVLSLAILGWPLDLIPVEIAKKVILGAVNVCNEANIPLAGGHSININVPVFGLSVNGFIDINHIKRNNSASEGNLIFLTKPLGIGIISTAQKKSILDDSLKNYSVKLMTTLNKCGEIYGKMDYIEAMTDVTGFGLIGHLSEMINDTELDAVIDFNEIPRIEGIDKYIKLNCIPGGTLRNIESFKIHVNKIDEYQSKILFDPQTSGGLLVAVKKEKSDEFIALSGKIKQQVYKIGYFTKKKNPSKNIIHIN